MPETEQQLTRIAAHIPCLERAAQDPEASPAVRARIALMAFLARSAVGVAGTVRTGVDAAERFGTIRNAAEQHRTEAGR